MAGAEWEFGAIGEATVFLAYFQDLPDLRHTIQIALEQNERRGLQSLRVLA